MNTASYGRWTDGHDCRFVPVRGQVIWLWPFSWRRRVDNQSVSLRPSPTLAPHHSSCLAGMSCPRLLTRERQ